MKCCMRCNAKRHPGCHSTCKEHADELAEDRARKKMIREAKSLEKDPPTRTARMYEGMWRRHAK